MIFPFYMCGSYSLYSEESSLAHPCAYTLLKRTEIGPEFEPSVVNLASTGIYMGRAQKLSGWE